MHVADIMTADVKTVGPFDRIKEAARLIVDHGISGVLVVEDGRLVGKVSHSDLLRRLFPTHKELYEDWAHNHDFEQIELRAGELADCTVEECMNVDVVTVSPDTPVLKVASWMLLKDVHRAAVVDDSDRLLGVVSRGDIFYSTLQSTLEEDREEAVHA